MTQKFSLHFAVGVDGEFGQANSLPWGSYKADLNEFWKDLESDAESGRVLIVGGTTWATLPLVVVTRLVQLFGGKIAILNRETPIDVIKNKHPNTNFTCIGGATALELIMLNEEVDYVYTTLIGSTALYRANVFLDMDLVSRTLNDMIIVSSQELEPYNEVSGTRYVFEA